MVVQAIQGIELSSAEVAFVGFSIPRPICGDGFDVRVAGEGDHRASDDVVAIELADHMVDLLAVEAGGGAFARFEAVGKRRSAKARTWVTPQGKWFAAQVLTGWSHQRQSQIRPCTMDTE